MGSNFQKCTFLETGAECLEPRRRDTAEGQTIREWDRKVVLLGDCGGAHVVQRQSSYQ